MGHKRLNLSHRMKHCREARGEGLSQHVEEKMRREGTNADLSKLTREALANGAKVTVLPPSKKKPKRRAALGHCIGRISGKVTA